MREIAARDLVGGPLDRDERMQPDPHDPESEHGDADEDGERDEQLDQQEPVQRAVDAGERRREDQDVGRAGID